MRPDWPKLASLAQTTDTLFLRYALKGNYFRIYLSKPFHLPFGKGIYPRREEFIPREKGSYLKGASYFLSCIPNPYRKKRTPPNLLSKGRISSFWVQTIVFERINNLLSKGRVSSVWEQIIAFGRISSFWEQIAAFGRINTLLSNGRFSSFWEQIIAFGRISSFWE